MNPKKGTTMGPMGSPLCYLFRHLVQEDPFYEHVRMLGLPSPGIPAPS